MKKIISFIVICSLITMQLTAAPIKIVDTTYEEELLESVGITEYSLVTEESWYFSKDGIDKTAKKMVEKLPASEEVILYGISLGGTVARRMTQIAKDNGKKVKGYIAQSSPLSGDRLTNTGWAVTSLALLGIYSFIGLNNLFWGLPLESFLKGEITNEDYDLYNQLDENSKALIKTCENGRNPKIVDRNNEQSIIENTTLPLLDAVFGSDEKGRGMSDYFGAVFSKGNNVKDLDPLGDFMEDVMNSSSSKQKEATDEIKRAFIVSTNGNIYESSAWENVEPIMRYYQKQRDSYWAKAKKQWWLFVYWSLRAAASAVSVETIEGLPRAWSTCVSGSLDYSTNDGFVPAKDTFWGKELKMTAPNMRSILDKSFTCNKVSHVDYGEGLNSLPSKKGRTYSRKQSLEQQKEAILKAYNFIEND